MNKKLREATKEEIASAYKNKAPSFIAGVRYRCFRDNNNIFANMNTGEIISRNGFNVYVAEKIKLGFEYRIYQSHKDRRFRLSKRIDRIIKSGKGQFLTLTFNNDFFERETSEITRRRYISRFLKEQCAEYVANIDYGESEKGTHREHYHAIVLPKNARIDYTPYCAFFDNSRIYAESITPTQKSNDSLSLYINKLTSHCLKESGKYKRLIYSRASRKTPLH